MEDANEDWVDLVTVMLINLRGAVDPLHILAYGLQVDFVVSANLNVAIGMTFQYENLKRHSFSLSVKSKKAAPTRADYTFAGWYKDAELTTALEDNATMPDAALTLYAKWNSNSYTVTFNANGGSGEMASDTATAGVAFTLPDWLMLPLQRIVIFMLPLFSNMNLSFYVEHISKFRLIFTGRR